MGPSSNTRGVSCPENGYHAPPEPKKLDDFYTALTKNAPILHGYLQKGTHIYTVIFEKAPISTPLSVIIKSNLHAISLSGQKNYPNGTQIYKFGKKLQSIFTLFFCKKATHFYTVFQKILPISIQPVPKILPISTQPVPKNIPISTQPVPKNIPIE